MWPALALALAAAPGLLAWWRGRSLLPLVGAEGLPERLLAHRQGVARASGIALALIVLGGGGHALWAIPACVLGLLAGSFPLRRAVLEETWTFSAYASHMLRLGTVPGRFVPGEAVEGQRVHGWSVEAGPLILDAGAGLRRTLALEPHRPGANPFATASGRLGVVRPGPAGARIELYRVE